MSATGAFLLLAAAALFVAVQWDHLGDEVKLGILAACTGGFLLGGRRLRRVLPATGSVVFHLGALLLPLCVATVALHQGVDWQHLLLVEGLLAAPVFAVLARSERSTVLRWACGAGVVVLCAGIGATTAVPAAIALVLASAIAEAMGRRRAALAWAATAGLAPAVALATHAVVGAGLGDPLVVRASLARLGEVGLSGNLPLAAGIGAGLIAALVIAHQARRRNEAGLLALAGVCAVVGGASSWVALAPGVEASCLGFASLFLLAEVAALLTRPDPFWARPAHLAAGGAEMLAGVATAGAAVAWWPLLALFGPVPPSAVPILVGALTGAGWFLADLRRRPADRTPPGIALLLGSGWPPAVPAMAASLIAGVAIGTRSADLTAASLVVVAALAVVSARPAAHVVAAVAAALAPLIADSPPLALVTGAVGAVLVAWAAELRSRTASPFATTATAATWATAAAALVPVATALAAAWDSVPAMVLVPGAATVAWIVALVLDRSPEGPFRHLALVGRLGAVAVLGLAAFVPPGPIALTAALLTVLAVVDASRRHDQLVAYLTALTGPVAVTATGLLLGWPAGSVGIACAVLGVLAAIPVVWSVSAAPLGRRRPVDRGLATSASADQPRSGRSGGLTAWSARWQGPLLAVTISSASAGLGLAAADPRALGVTLMLVGGLIVAVTLGQRETAASLAGAALVTVGAWVELAAFHIDAIDLYAVPIGAALLAAGMVARRPGPDGSDAPRSEVTSWVAYGPAVALLAGTALVVRMTGGGWPHAVGVGLVAVVAVVTGGARRLAAPLLLGTGFLVALTVHESLALSAQVPTWAWLALGGVTLVGAGILLERRETGPLEAGRRIVDVVHDRFG